jgi:hypothetical protein
MEHREGMTKGWRRITAEYAMRDRISARFRAIDAAASHAWAAVPARAVNPSLRMMWRPAANFAMQCR